MRHLKYETIKGTGETYTSCGKTVPTREATTMREIVSCAECLESAREREEFYAALLCGRKVSVRA